uniref:ShKT domain-containing protein n=1 Tax=Heterorhabditis bacteriophora TaxID=37862 RepID=A0A1I7WWA4_HETBA
MNTYFDSATFIEMLLFLSSLMWVHTEAMHKPDLYMWLEQNSYICDLDLFNFRNSMRFLSVEEARTFNCQCGDPLISKAACARKPNELPMCHPIPDLCMREYTILFTATEDRLSQPLTTRAFLRSSIKTTTVPTRRPVTVHRQTRPPSSPQNRIIPPHNQFRRPFFFIPAKKSLTSNRRPLNRKQNSFNFQNRNSRNRITRRPITQNQRRRPFINQRQSRRLIPTSFMITSTRPPILKQRLVNRKAEPPLQNLLSTTSSIPVTTSKFTTKTTEKSSPISTTTIKIRTVTTTPTILTTQSLAPSTSSVTTTDSTTTSTTTTSTAKVTETSRAQSTVVKDETTETLTTQIPSNTTHNNFDTLKESKTELLLAELMSRIKAMGNREPEHPLMGLGNILANRQNQQRETPITDHKVSDNVEKNKPETLNDDFRTEFKVPETGVKMEHMESSQKPRNSLISSSLKKDSKEKMTEEEIFKKENVRKLLKEKKIIMTSEIPVDSESTVFTQKPMTQKMTTVVTHKPITTTATTMKTTMASHKTTLTPRMTIDLMPKQKWVSNEQAIEFLRRKIEELEQRLLQRFSTGHFEVNTGAAKDDEVPNTKHQQKIGQRKESEKEVSRTPLTKDSFMGIGLADDSVISLMTTARLLTEKEELDMKREFEQMRDIKGSVQKRTTQEGGDVKADKDSDVHREESKAEAMEEHNTLSETKEELFQRQTTVKPSPKIFFTTSKFNAKKCENNHDLCDYWTFYLQCTKNPAFMYKYCRKSCGICDFRR